MPKQAPRPNPDLKSLDKLVGTWKLSGDATGQSRFEWAEGGFFLLHHVDELVVFGRTIKGIEVIGHFQGLGEEPSKEIKTRFYHFLGGLTLDYVYEANGDTVTIWFGEKGSSNLYKGKFSKDGNTMTGAWQWPGGGYSVTGTRIA